MSKGIVYKADDGTIFIIWPNVNCGLTLEQIAAKDVPSGKPYKIVDVSDMPTDPRTDPTFLAAWEVDTSSPDGAGADYGIGSMNSVTAWSPDGTPVLRKESICQ